MKTVIQVTPYGSQSGFLKQLYNDFAISNLNKKGQLTIKNVVEMIDRTGKGYSTKDIDIRNDRMSILYKGQLKMKLFFQQVASDYEFGENPADTIKKFIQGDIITAIENEKK